MFGINRPGLSLFSSWASFLFLLELCYFKLKWDLKTHSHLLLSLFELGSCFYVGLPTEPVYKETRVIYFFIVISWAMLRIRIISFFVYEERYRP